MKSIFDQALIIDIPLDVYYLSFMCIAIEIKLLLEIIT